MFASRSSADSLPELEPLDFDAESRSSMARHRFGHDGEMPKSFATWVVEESDSRWTRITSARNSLGNAFGMVHALPAPTHIDADQMSPIRAADPDAAEAYRDVYDFCNRFSRGDGSEHVDVLDARAVHGQIRRTMEFLKNVDPKHFSRMCKATAVDEGTLA